MIAATLGLALALPGAATAQAAKIYTATDHDTFWFMSKRFNVPLQELMDANPKIDPLNIYAGLKIVIPDTNAASAKSAPERAVTVNGKSFRYARVLDATATAYSASAGEKWGAVDYFGNPLKLGTVAVDPKVIPFGTKLYITGYSFKGLPQGGMLATASDTGGAIKGNRIDIFIPGSRDYVRSFGIQDVKIYVLE
jgi:3D (Asp-Asp-Asp) domain-containing protein